MLMVGIKNIVIRTAENGQDYTGIKLGKDANSYTKIIVPKYYMPDMDKSIDALTKDEKRKLKQLVKAWRKYQSRLKTKNNGEIEGTGINFDFDIVLKIVQDFLESGLYIEFERTEILSNVGKIDFPRTIKKCRPTILDEGPLYLPYITRAKKIADENLVRNTQILVLNDIAKKVGWLIGFNIHIPPMGISAGLNKSLISKLKVAKNNSYNTRKLKLIDYLVQYIAMLDLLGNDDRNFFVSAVYKFWEDMIADIVGNVDHATLEKIFYIRHRYINKRTGAICKTPRDLNPLMPDAVFMKATNIIILDAKYYNKDSLPTNDDITKQFAYMRKAYGYYGKGYNYRNIFILPTDDSYHYSNREAVFDVDAHITRGDDLVPIEVMYLNVTEVICNYISSVNISTSVL